MIDPERILRVVSASSGIPVPRIRGPLRHRRYTGARFLAALLMRWEGWSYPVIGNILGRRDHTTAMAAVRAAGDDLEQLAMAADVAVRCELERGLP